MENLRDSLPGIKRQICLAHLRKTLFLRTRELRTEAEKLKRLHLRYTFARPVRKGEKVDIFYRMRMLTLRLWQRADELALYKKVGGDGTNNTTERLIGLCGKIRYRQMRGFKSKESLNRFLKLNAYLQEQDKEIDLTHLL